MKRKTLKMSDGKMLSVGIWEDVNSPKAVVQISHGMAEHIARYDQSATFFNSRGFIVLGDDHRAHGETDAERLGMAEEGRDLFADTVRDMSEITDFAALSYGLPIILLGHSYGSFLAQEYLLSYSEKICGCVLSGSALYSPLITAFGSFAASRASKKRPNEAGMFFANQTFNAYDKKLKCEKNGWLSHNVESNARYTADPMCGFVCSNGFYKHFFAHLKMLTRTPFSSVRSSLPLLIAYGNEDYVSGCGKQIFPLIRKYIKAGVLPDIKIYDGMRHEILNEQGRERVMQDLADFFDRALSLNKN